MNRWQKNLRSVPVSIWCLMLVYVLFFVVVSDIHYRYFFYTGLDVAIYDQVVWNTAHGRLFAYTFNPYSYLVDHREWLLVLLTPLYWVVAHPLALLVVQTVVLASGAIPLYRLARHLCASSAFAHRIAFVAVLVYLLNPTIQGMNLYEFHLLTWAVPLSLWLWFSIEQQRFRLVWFFSVLLLLLREDVALMLVGVGVLWMVAYRQQWRRAVVLIGASSFWFAVMVWMGGRLSPDGVEKFVVLFDWLGQTPQEVIRAVVNDPLRLLSVFLDYDHGILLVFLFLNGVFLPFFALRYLIPAVIPGLLFLAVNQYMIFPVIKAHYGAVVVPWFLIAGLYGYRRISRQPWFQRAQLGSAATVIVFMVVCLQWLNLGPLWGVLHQFDLMRDRNLNDYQAVIDAVGPNDAVLVSSRLYPHLSEREFVYTSMHTFTGKQHFAETDYTPPERLDWIILEQEQIVYYGVHLPEEHRKDAWKRLNTLIVVNDLSLVQATEDLIVFGHGESVMPVVRLSPQSLSHSVQLPVDERLQFDSWEYQIQSATRGDLFLAFERLPNRSAQTDDHFIQVSWYDEQGVLMKQKIVAIGAGLDPTHQWKSGSEQQRVVRLPMTNPVGAARVEIAVGLLTVEFGPLFTVWTADPVLDSEHSTSFVLDDLLEYHAALEK